MKGLGDFRSISGIRKSASCDAHDCVSQVGRHIRPLSSELTQGPQVHHVPDAQRQVLTACCCGQMLCSTTDDANWKATDSTSFLRNGCSEVSSHTFNEKCIRGPQVLV
jgi:hypothetical protein